MFERLVLVDDQFLHQVVLLALLQRALAALVHLVDAVHAVEEVAFAPEPLVHEQQRQDVVVQLQLLLVREDRLAQVQLDRVHLQLAQGREAALVVTLGQTSQTTQFGGETTGTSVRETGLTMEIYQGLQLDYILPRVFRFNILITLLHAFQCPHPLHTHSLILQHLSLPPLHVEHFESDREHRHEHQVQNEQLPFDRVQCVRQCQQQIRCEQTRVFQLRAHVDQVVVIRLHVHQLQTLDHCQTRIDPHVSRELRREPERQRVHVEECFVEQEHSGFCEGVRHVFVDGETRLEERVEEHGYQQVEGETEQDEHEEADFGQESADEGGEEDLVGEDAARETEHEHVQGDEHCDQRVRVVRLDSVARVLEHVDSPPSEVDIGQCRQVHDEDEHFHG